MDTLVAEQVNLISVPALTGPLAVAAKIRHTHEPAAATIEPHAAGGVLVRFERPQRAPAPGPSVVFYQGDLVVGGGVISRPEAP
jgi:tRNA-specific 2-thiouridylase